MILKGEQFQKKKKKSFCYYFATSCRQANQVLRGGKKNKRLFYRFPFGEGRVVLVFSKRNFFH